MSDLTQQSAWDIAQMLLALGVRDLSIPHRQHTHSFQLPPDLATACWAAVSDDKMTSWLVEAADNPEMSLHVCTIRNSRNEVYSYMVDLIVKAYGELTGTSIYSVTAVDVAVYHRPLCDVLQKFLTS